MLKDMKKNVKKKSFFMNDVVKQAFHKLKNVFQQAFVLIHFDPSLFIRVETDAFNFELTGILSQLQKDEQWRSVVFYSKKMISVERNYETHDQKLLAIVMCFKQWRHYLNVGMNVIACLNNH